MLSQNAIGKYGKSQIVMIPFAGGTSQSYAKNLNEIEQYINVCYVDYSGHGTRYKYPLMTHFKDVVIDIKLQIKPFLQNPIVLFGHSMGGMVAAYLSMLIYPEIKQLLKGVIISSCLPPNEFMDAQSSTSFSDEDLYDYMRNVRKVPEDVLLSKEFEDYLLPVLKNDFLLLHNFTDEWYLTLPPCPIFCIYGEQDNGIEGKSLYNWNNYAQSPVVIKNMVGTHFYFEEYRKKTIELVKGIVDYCLK